MTTEHPVITSDNLKRNETTPAQRFDQDHKQILDQYRSELPDLDTQPKIVQVIPSLAELSNDNFWRLLRTLTHQKGVSTSEYATLIVVNNDGESGELARGEVIPNQFGWMAPLSNYPNLDLSKNRYNENQRHIAILRHLAKAQQAITETQLPLEKRNHLVDDYISEIKDDYPLLTPYEEAVCRQAIKKGVQVFPVDCSSKNKALVKNDPTDSYLGMAKNIGGHLAYELLEQTESNPGLIDYLDGDCYLSDNYMASAIAALPFSSGRFLIKPMLTQQVDIPERIGQEKDPYTKIAALFGYLSSSIIQRRSDYLRRTAVGATLGGPQIAISPKLFREINGYVTQNANTDFRFAEKAEADCPQPLYMTGGRVYLSDRGREGSVDGIEHGHLQIEEFTGMELIAEAHRRSNEVNIKAIDDVLREHRVLRLIGGQRYADLTKQLFHKEALRRKFFINTTNVLIPMICDAYQRTLGDTMNTLIDLKAKVNNREWDFLLANRALVEAVTIAYDINGKKETGVLDFFKKYLPEYFASPPATEPDYYAPLSEESVNPRDYIHVAEAYYEWSARRKSAQITGPL